MDCKEFESRIPDFLDDKLNKKQANDFFAHMHTCKDCMEELRIQYLIKEVPLRIEDGESFDLNKELDIKIEKTKKTIKKRSAANTVIYIMEAIAIVAVIFILFLVFTRGR
jgi:hypothetical protein